jgi:hypothetical protein
MQRGMTIMSTCVSIPEAMLVGKELDRLEAIT